MCAHRMRHMDNTQDPLNALDQSQIEELARQKLEARDKARARARKQRAARRAAGWHTITAEVQERRVRAVRYAIRHYVEMTDKQFDASEAKLIEKFGPDY